MLSFPPAVRIRLLPLAGNRVPTYQSWRLSMAPTMTSFQGESAKLLTLASALYDNCLEKFTLSEGMG